MVASAAGVAPLQLPLPAAGHAPGSTVGTALAADHSCDSANAMAELFHHLCCRAAAQPPLLVMESKRGKETITREKLCVGPNVTTLFCCLFWCVCVC